MASALGLSLGIASLLFLGQLVWLATGTGPLSTLADRDCAPPCLLGLHPGITTREEAVAQLVENPWLSAVIVSQELQRTNTGYLFLEWSGRQPDVINDRLVASIWIDVGRVALIRLPLTTTLGALALEFAPPEAPAFVRLSHTSTLADVPLTNELSARATLRCPYRRSEVWGESPELRAGHAINLPDLPATSGSGSTRLCDEDARP